jgi:hypothetical protein
MCIWIHIYSNLTFIPMLILPTAESRGVLLSFHLFTLSEKGTSMETNRIASRRALALIQIRASDADASSFARCANSLSRLAPVSRRCRVAPAERAAWVLPSCSSLLFRRGKTGNPSAQTLLRTRHSSPRMNAGAFWLGLGNHFSRPIRCFFPTGRTSSAPPEPRRTS